MAILPGFDGESSIAHIQGLRRYGKEPVESEICQRSSAGHEILPFSRRCAGAEQRSASKAGSAAGALSPRR